MPGKALEKIKQGEKHLKNNAAISHSQHGFMREQSCLSISIYDKVAHPVAQGKPVDVIFLDFSKAFVAASHCILLDKVSSSQLDKHILWWVSYCLMGWALRVTVIEVSSDWG